MCVIKIVSIFIRVVEFASYRDMKKAIEKLDGTDVNGRKIKVTAASRGRRLDFYKIESCLHCVSHLFNT